MITGINHIGIAVNSIEEQIPFYKNILKFEFLGVEEVTEQKVKVAIFKVGDIKIELLEPTSPESPISKFLEKKGIGIHHIAYQADNIKEQISQLKEKDVKMIDDTPRSGAHNTKIAFIHPKSSGKILTEICE